jgi:hypothetical protein
MNKSIRLMAVAVALSSGFAASVAQAQAQMANPAASQAPVTRAQTKQQLKTLEQNGYDPAQNDTQYPNNLQAAEKRAQGASGTAATTGSTAMSPTPKKHRMRTKRVRMSKSKSNTTGNSSSNMTTPSPGNAKPTPEKTDSGS